MHSEELALKRHGQLFLSLIEYAFVGVSFQTQNLWEESIKMNHATRFTNICARQITGICTII